MVNKNNFFGLNINVNVKSSENKVTVMPLRLYAIFEAINIDIVYCRSISAQYILYV